ncbi:MAG TPA: hypothetical protein PKD46_12370 [Aggregatilineaceae bacterium]|nr:hypothetical protein [Aggregatilineaceae bacterium]
MTTDFTLAAFATFCRQLAPLRVLTVRDYLRVAPCPPFLILRFDVDFREPFALRLGQILAAHGIRASFYFRCHASGFEWSAIHAIGALGHEVGYHYEALDRCRGDFDAAESLFLADIHALRAGDASVETVAAHGAPPVAAGYASNLDLLRARPDLLGRARLRGDAVASVDFTRLTYFSDAGWRWRRCNGTPPGSNAAPSSLAELYAAGVRPDAALYANIHPQHWYARPSGLRYYRWRHRLGVHLLPRLRAVRAALASDQTRHQQ